MKQRHSHIRLWYGCTLGIAATCFVDGVGYAILGDEIAHGSSYSILDRFPGGMHTFGVLMLVISLLVIEAARRQGVASERILLGVFVFATLMTCEIIGGWVYRQEVSISPITKWFIIGWFSLWLAAHRPISKR